MKDIEQAKSIIKSGSYTCVVCKGETVYSSAKSGVLPMIEFISSGKDLNGFSAADKIIGKAAAMLFILSGIIEVHASVMSEAAADTLSQHGVIFSCGHLIKNIQNREGTGICPMEKAVADIREPFAALEAIKQTIETLKKRNMEGNIH